MAELAQNAERDFWRPPVVPIPTAVEPKVKSGMVEVCDRCETEFIAGSRFCHVCGATRSERGASHRLTDWLRQAWTGIRQLEFHNLERGVVSMRQQLALTTAPLVAFLIGLACVVGAVGTGLLFTVQTTLDWQAVQLWRIEWLLGASASFLAGILLKKSTN
jgi:hypothetical protein